MAKAVIFIAYNVDGMKSWGLKSITYHTALNLINSKTAGLPTYTPIFYTVC